MKERHREAERFNARAVLVGVNAAVGQDFHSLRREQVEKLLAEADRVRYQKPQAANGSRARYFYARLQRLAG